MNLIEFIQNNIIHVLPILSAGAFALVIILERAKALFQVYPLKDSKNFFERLTDLIMASRIQEAILLCDQNPNELARKIVKSALYRAHLPDEAIKQSIEITFGDTVRLVQKRTSFLATIANVATLLGLFGTIAGLIHSFEAVGHADPQQKAALLSAGIATAMNATMLGLGVAIPCMVAFSFLINRSNSLIGELEEAALKAEDILKLRYFVADQVETDLAKSKSNGSAASLFKQERKAA